MKSAAFCLLVVLLSVFVSAQSSHSQLVDQSKGIVSPTPHLRYRPRLGQGKSNQVQPAAEAAKMPLFLEEPQYATANYPLSAVVADFNGDRKPDLAVADMGAGCPGF